MYSNNSYKGRFGSLRAALCLGAGLTALSAFAAPALAQEDVAEEETTRTLQTVTITATKREQTLQDVPIAVSVVDDSTIARAAIVDLNDLQSVVPSLTVGQLQSSANTNFIIRGFGNGANNAGIEPSVGVFIDGVYRSRSASQISTFRTSSALKCCATAIDAVRQERFGGCRLGGDQEAAMNSAVG